VTMVATAVMPITAPPVLGCARSHSFHARSPMPSPMSSPQSSPRASSRISLRSMPSQVQRLQSSRENDGVHIVQKKGDVVVWGPRGRSKDGARLPRIICYGDSNTAGFCHDGRKFQPYGKSLASEMAMLGSPCEVAVCGLCGYTTEDMLREKASDYVRPNIGPSGRGLQRMLEEDGPVDLVIIMTGTNDMGFYTPLPTIVQHVAQLHSICHDRGIPTVAVAPTQCSGLSTRKMRQLLANELSKWARTSSSVISYLDVEDLLPRPVGKDGTSNNHAAAQHWERDDLHLSFAGSVKLGRALASHATTWMKKIKSGHQVSKASHRKPLVQVQAIPAIASFPPCFPEKQFGHIQQIPSLSEWGSARRHASPLASARSISPRGGNFMRAPRAASFSTATTSSQAILLCR